MDIGNYLAGGGVSGAIIAGLYIAYKCCYRRKFHSKCCNAEMDVGASEPSPQLEVKPAFEHKPTPRPSPALRPESKGKEVELPPLEV
jgi:hypothetical protein